MQPPFHRPSQGADVSYNVSKYIITLFASYCNCFFDRKFKYHVLNKFNTFFLFNSSYYGHAPVSFYCKMTYNGLLTAYCNRAVTAFPLS